MLRFKLLVVLLLLNTSAYAQPNVTVNGLFAGKAIIKINGVPTMFFEGDKKQGIKLISANEDQAIVEIKGKRHNMRLDESIANEYSKPVKPIAFGEERNEIGKVELVHQTHNIVTFAVEYEMSETSTDYQLIAQLMVDKKAVDYASYNYVPLKPGKHLTYITLGIAKTAPAEFESDHILVNFVEMKGKQAAEADNAKIIPLPKRWQH